jgi:hypothetical protein
VTTTTLEKLDAPDAYAAAGTPMRTTEVDAATPAELQAGRRAA